MVRFKSEQTLRTNQPNNPSQFHYGSIQMNTIALSPVSIFSLNSTMVRFKYDKSAADLSLKELSQFHYGSIQIQPHRRKPLYNSIVSIPLWFDSN